MFSLALRRLVLLLLLCLSLAPCAWASQRVILSPGANIRGAQLIVVADSATDTHTFDTTVAVKEVLKGDANWIGQTLLFPRNLGFSILPREARNCVLFLESAPPNSTDPFTVLEAFKQPDQIAATRTLLPIYALPTERTQLLALRELWTSDDKILRAQFVEDLGEMHESRNFALLLDFLPRADLATKKHLVERLGRIGDPRALPLLMAMMENPKTPDNLRYSAAWQLNFYFPGAPGVTPAFRQVFPEAKGNLRRMAADYLNEREPSAKYWEVLPTPTLWMRATALLEKGNNSGARELWWQVLAAPNTDDFARRWAAMQILPLKDTEKARFRDTTLPLIQRDSQVDNYLWRRDDAQILRAMARPEDAELLMSLSDKSGNSDVTRRVVMMTLLEMNETTQRKAAAHWLQNLAKNSEGTASNFPHPDLMALAWLGSDDDWQQAKTILGADWQRSGTFLIALFKAAHAMDEGAALTDLLEHADELQEYLQAETLGWIVFRLADLGDARAVPALTKFLLRHGTYDDYGATKALTRIGQKNAQNEMIVVEAMTSVLTRPAGNRVSGEAVEIIAALQGARARPLLRRIIADGNPGPKMEAMGALSHVGTPDDLPLLLPLADFWTAPRGLQGWAVAAVTHLRRRFHLDVGDVKIKAKA